MSQQPKKIPKLSSSPPSRLRPPSAGRRLQDGNKVSMTGESKSGGVSPTRTSNQDQSLSSSSDEKYHKTPTRVTDRALAQSSAQRAKACVVPMDTDSDGVLGEQSINYSFSDSPDKSLINLSSVNMSFGFKGSQRVTTPTSARAEGSRIATLSTPPTSYRSPNTALSKALQITPTLTSPSLQITPSLTPSGAGPSLRSQGGGEVMSTPLHGGLQLQHDPFSFDEEAMAREAELVMAAIQASAGGLADSEEPSLMNDSAALEVSLSDTYSKVESNTTQTLPNQLNSTYDASLQGNTTYNQANTTQTLQQLNATFDTAQGQGHNTTQTLNTTTSLDNNQLNDTQTLHQHVLNTTETIDPQSSADNVLNTTETLQSHTTENNVLNTTEILESHTTSENVLNTTETLETHAATDNVLNTTQTLNNNLNTTHSLGSGDVLNTTQSLETERPVSSTPNQQAQHDVSPPVEDTSVTHVDTTPPVSSSEVMKMSVDDPSSKAGSNMTVSMDSVNGPEEIPVDTSTATELHSTFNASPAANQQSDVIIQSEPSAPADVQSMQVDEPDVTVKVSPPSNKKSVANQAKTRIPDKRKTLPAAGSKPVKPTKPRESLLPPPKSKEKPKTPEKPAQPAKVIQKSKPKSKWADISKQIEKSAATSPKPATKNVQSKFATSNTELDHIDGSELNVESSLPSQICIARKSTPGGALLERTGSVSSDVSQTSNISAISSKSKPLKRQSLLPPSTSSTNKEFKKPRASLLPPPSTRSTTSGGGIPAPSRVPGSKLRINKVPADKTPTIQTISDGNTNSNNKQTIPTTQTISSVGPQPDVVASTTPPKRAPTTNNRLTSSPKHSPKAALAALQSKLEENESHLEETRSQLQDALRLNDEEKAITGGLRRELAAACRGVEGLGVIVQYYSQLSNSTKQELVKSREESNLLTKSHHEELLNYQSETELLAKNHESEKQAVIAQMTARHEREMSKIKSAHAAEIDSIRQHLESSHSKVLHDVSTNHQATVEHLQEEISQLKSECCDWKIRFDEATQALHKDMDHRLQVALQPYEMLPQEIESLKTVVELKSDEVKELRNENNRYKQKVDTIPDIEKKLYDMKLKLENTEALLEIVSKKEKETAEKYHKITRKAVQEKKENHRLSLNVEALELKLEEVEFNQSIHLDSNTSELDVSTASLPAYSIENPDQSPSQFSRTFARSSIKRRSQRNSCSGVNSSQNNNNNQLGVSSNHPPTSPSKSPQRPT